MKESKDRRVFSLATTCLLGLSILLLATSIITVFIHWENPQAAYLCGFKPIYITSDTMAPAIIPSSIVVAQQIALTDIQVGDIILRNYNDQMVIRRVTRITTTGELVTEADNRAFEDATTLDTSNYIAKILWR